MIVKETFDKDLIMSVIADPAIWKCIGGEGIEPEKFEFDIDENTRILAGEVDSKPVGIMVFSNKETGWECHINVLPIFRKRYAHDFCDTCLDWFYEQIGGNLYATIGKEYPNVIKFAQNHGFATIRDAGNSYRMAHHGMG